MMSFQSRAADRGDGPWAIGELLPLVLATIIDEPPQPAGPTGYVDFASLDCQPRPIELMSVS